MQDRISQIFKAIADPTRREIFHALVVASSALTISQIASQFDMTRQGVTKHIKTLEEASLVHLHTKGRERLCQAKPERLADIQQWLRTYEQFWNTKLDDLEHYLSEG